MSAPGANPSAVDLAAGGLVLIGMGAFFLRYRKWLWLNLPGGSRRGVVPDEYEDGRIRYVLSFIVGPCFFVAVGTVLLLVAVSRVA